MLPESQHELNNYFRKQLNTLVLLSGTKRAQDVPYDQLVLAALTDCHIAWSRSTDGGNPPTLLITTPVLTLARAANLDLYTLLDSLDIRENKEDLYSGLMTALRETITLVRSKAWLNDTHEFSQGNFMVAVNQVGNLLTRQVTSILEHFFKLIVVQSDTTNSDLVNRTALMKHVLTEGWDAEPHYGNGIIGGPRILRADLEMAESNGPDSPFFPTKHLEYVPMCLHAIEDIFGFEGGPLVEYPKLAGITLADEPVPMQMSHCIHGITSELKELWDATSVSAMVGELGDLFWFSVNLARLADPEFSFRNCIVIGFPGTFLGTSSFKLDDHINKISLSVGDVADLVKSRVHYGEEWSKDDAFLVSCRTKSIVKQIADLIPAINHRLRLTFGHSPDQTCGLVIEDILARNILKLRKRYPDLGFSPDAAINRDYNAESEAAGINIE